MGIRVLAAAAIVLSLAACGGKGGGPATTAESASTAHWRAGFAAWGRHMIVAIDGISVIFSQPASVRGIQSGEPKVAARLDTFERTLLGCRGVVEELGTAPAKFLPARVQALRACADLEQGAGFVRDGIKQLQSGQGVDLLDRSSQPLASGQDSVRRAELELDTLS